MKQLWEIEEKLWLEGEDSFARHLDANAVMVLSGSAGILRKQALVEGLRGAPRWRSVDMACREHALHGGCAVLAYRATANSEGDDRYRALCMSVYEDRDAGWCVIAHQQTPI